MKRIVTPLICLALLSLFSALGGQENLKIQLAQLIQKEAALQSLTDSLTRRQGNSTLSRDPDPVIAKLNASLKKLRREILEIKSHIYDTQASQAVWAEGNAELALDENKPFEQQKRLALMYARRDAMEKGGQLIIESLTELRRSELTNIADEPSQSRYQEEFKSIIRSKGKVRVVEQDDSGHYSKVVTLEENGIKKLRVTVRLKMVPIENFNPFREELKNE